MKPVHPLAVARSLRAVFRDPLLRFPYFDPYASTDPLERGIAYHAVPRKRGNLEGRWFIELPAVRHLFPATLPFTADVTYVVSWLKLLAQAKMPANTMTKAIHKLWWFLLPVVEQYDAVLATELRLWRTKHNASRPEEQANPLFVGQGYTDDEFERFNAHLESILKNEGFVHYATASLNKTFAVALWPKQHRELRAQYGDPPIFDDTVLLGDEQLASGVGIAEALRYPVRFRHTDDAWSQVIRYLVDAGAGGTDGAWGIDASKHFGVPLLVNWAKLVEICEAQGWAPHLTRPLKDNYTAFLAGDMARIAFDAYTHGACVTKRPKPINELIESVGEKAPSSIETPWELYNVTALIDQLHTYTTRVERAKLARAKKLERGEAPQAYTMKMVYLDYNGTPIQVIRRRMKKDVEPLFSVPYELPREYGDRRVWAGKRYRYRGLDFWTLHGITAHSNGSAEDEVPKVLEAEAFRRWAYIEQGKLEGNGFTKAVFEQNYGSRVQEKNRKEREHLGFFTAEEDRCLSEFFALRKPGPLTPAETKELEGVAPGRTVRAVMRRRDELGLKYARKHGYLAYLKSGYCAKRSAARRARWLALGVPL